MSIWLQSIHWTLLSNFNILHLSQILHCLKAIVKYRNMHARLFALRFHACTYCCIRAKIIVFIGPSWATLIFFIISKFTLDPHEQQSFSSSANSTLLKSYNLIKKSACIFMCIALACMQISLPWYLLDNHFKLHKNLTLLRWNIMVCLLLQVACTFTCACMQLCMHACK